MTGIEKLIFDEIAASEARVLAKVAEALRFGANDWKLRGYNREYTLDTEVAADHLTAKPEPDYEAYPSQEDWGGVSRWPAEPTLDGTSLRGLRLRNLARAILDGKVEIVRKP